MNRRPVLLVLLILVALAAAWQLNAKRSVLKSGWDDMQTIIAESKLKAETVVKTGLPSAGLDVEPEYEGPPVAVPAPELEPATDGEMFPFDANTSLLEKTVPLPTQLPPLVYIGHGVDSNSMLTSESIWLGEFMKYQARAQSTSRTLLNILPNAFLLQNATRRYESRPSKHTHDDYLKDAISLGAQYLFEPMFDGSTSAPVVTVHMLDLSTSRTKVWNSTQAGIQSVHGAIVEGSIEIMRFTGLPEDLIESSGVRNGAPSDESFQFFCTTNDGDFTYENMMAQLETDKDFVGGYNYSYGTTTVLQLVDQGLRRFPNDVRLQVTKGITLSEAKTTASMLRFTSELMRRYPENLYVYVQLGERLGRAYPSVRAMETPLGFRTIVEQTRQVSDAYKDCYALTWNYAYTLRSLANYIRGCETSDRVPQTVWAQHGMFNALAYKQMKKIVDKNQDNPLLLTSFIFYDTDAGESSFSEQRAYIKKVAALDARETRVENQVAHWHSIGYGNQRDYFRVMDDAFKAHSGDPKALIELVDALSEELQRQIGWKAMTQDEAYTTSNPYVTRLLAQADYIYSQGMNLGFDTDWNYKGIMEMRGHQDVINKWKESGQNSMLAFWEAEAATKTGDWARVLKYAQLAKPFVLDDKYGHLCRYYEIKALWKLKRYEESLKAAREGVKHFPDEATFPYMYAVVALEYGKNLEVAYDCAVRGVELDPKNDGAVQTKRKLAEKLNKPVN